MSHQIAIVIRHFAEKQVLKLTPNYLIFYLEIIGSRSLNGGGGGFPREFWIGVCREGSWTLTLFKD